MKKKYLLLIITGLQILFLASMIWFHQAKLNSATRVLLKTVPVDPLSVFRGRYVSLNYEISSLPIALLKDVRPQDLKGSEDLFVMLKKLDGLWQAEGIYRRLPKDSQRVYIRGRIPYYYRFYGGQNKLGLDYGIESFFLNEKSADELERQPRDWQAAERRRQELILKLDQETQRISKAGISEWWFKTLDKELEVWLNQGLVNQKTKDAIHDKYRQALDRLSPFQNEPSGQDPLIVEVAIDRDGNGYPTKLFFRGKEYR